jgi:protein-disulfide isomerase/uncharacterized membrane protein
MSAESARSALRRLLTIASVLSTLGVAVSAVILWVHAQIEAGGAAYTSFCNVSSSINCDRVLASEFSRIGGLPIAWLALFAYAALGSLFGTALRARGPRARGALVLALAGSVGAAAFSLHMAFLSLFVLHTLCLMCTGLYAVSLGLLWVSALVPSRYARAYADHDAPRLNRRALALTSLAVLLTATALAAASWSASTGELPAEATLAEFRAQDEEFYAWYTALPVLNPGAGLHAIGSDDAPVTITEFSDFECGHCARNHGLLKQLLAHRGDRVRIVYRHFPLDAACNEALDQSVHTRACRAAEAAECAGEQGRFYEMVDLLFENQERLFEGFLFTLAERAKLDVERFRDCLSEHRGLSAVLADARDGNRLGITSTPTLFLNGRQVAGTFSDLRRYVYAVEIEAQLAAERAIAVRETR